MKLVRREGFTLIELLTVIAIIAILAGMTAVTLPRVLEKAKMADADADLKQIATSLVQYYTDHGTYPGAYGYRMLDEINNNPTYNHHPYVMDIGIEEALKIYDRFSYDYDTNNDDILSGLEFVPLPKDVGDIPPVPDPFLLFQPLDLVNPPYPGAGSLTWYDDKRASTPRPYTYIPYYSKDLARMKRIIKNLDPADRPPYELGDWHPDYIPDDPQAIIMPPANYDGFVLIGVGPQNHTRGLLSPAADEDAWLAATGESPVNYYYVLGMRAAYLGTRDLNENGLYDFDYRARTQQGERQIYPNMPDGLLTSNALAAPMIYGGSQ